MSAEWKCAAAALSLALVTSCTDSPSTSPSSAGTPASSPRCASTPGEPVQGASTAGSGPRARLLPGMELTVSPSTLAGARRGEPLRVFGRVLQSDCRTPVHRAAIQVWQTNGDGDYGPAGNSENSRCCYLQATVTTDASGRYELLTVRPGPYRGANPAPPAHIHFDVRSATAGGLLTELNFAGDPALADGAGSNPVASVYRADGALQARFDIVLP